MSTIQFSKMHGLGNDFLVVEGVSQSIHLNPSLVKHWADRHVGIGFDQLLCILPSKKADFACAIFNSDGSEAEQCGNGMRCIARFLHEQGLIHKKSVTIETKAGVTEIFMDNYEKIQVNMGVPRFDPIDVPFLADRKQHLYEIPLEEGEPGLALSILSMGNPHAILQVKSIENFPVEKFGPIISTHKWFPKGVNVGFMEIVNPAHIRVRTYERGAGETLACGSNACAAVVAGIYTHILENTVKVELALGDLHVAWKSEDAPVLLTGPAVQVFSGSVNF